MSHTQQHLKAVSEQFQYSGVWVDGIPYGTGHINDTYLVQWQINGSVAFNILQRINHLVFNNPPQLMDNIMRVTRHLQQRVHTDVGRRESMAIIPTRNGQPYYRDGNGDFWRMYVFVKDAKTVDVCTNPAQAYEAARAFGDFQANLVDLPGGSLHETIPYFHHTPKRFEDLEDVIRLDPGNRATGVRREIQFCLARKPLASAITGLIAGGCIPERTTHNDTKINNVMLDNQTGEGVCVIDLDTVMAGCVLYDFGDMARTMSRSAAEDEQDLGQVGIDLVMFDALTRGYLEGTRSFLTPVEIEHMSVAGQVITFTIGIRFLTDYLLGDVYFKIHRPGQNLDRARVQFKMVESMEQQEKAINAVVHKYT